MLQRKSIDGFHLDTKDNQILYSVDAAVQHGRKEPTMASSTATATASYSSIPNLIGEWIRQGTEGFIATQKILLDLAAQQNALALTILRERLGMSLPNVTGAVI